MTREEHPITVRWLTAAIGTAAVLSTSCGLVGPTASDQSDADASIADCSLGPIHANVRVDLSGTRVSEPLSKADDVAVQALVRRTLICSGSLEVSTFSSSVASTVALYSGSLHLDGATETARLRRVPDATDAVMSEIRQRLDEASNQVSTTTGGTDVLGQLGLIEEFGRQLQNGSNDDAELVGLIVTDGEDTEQLQLADPALSTSTAVQIADAATVPNLDGVDLSMISIGKSSNGVVASTPHVDALKSAWSRICERSGAGQCTVVTDAANGQ